MASYIGYRDGSGYTNEQGLKQELYRLFSGGVSYGHSSTSLQVSQRGAGANLSVDVAVGDAHLPLPNGLYSYWGWTDAVSNVAISAASPSNPRIDAVVAYVDLSVTSGTNNPGALKLTAIAGMAAASPSVPSDSAIQAALGASVPFLKLAQVAVAASATQIVNANITDLREAISLKARLGDGSVDRSAALANGIVEQAKLANGAVTPSKLSTGGSSASVATPQTTASTSYTDLATVGPSVTVTIGANGLALVMISANMQNNAANNFAYGSVAASGANTIAAADAQAISFGLVGVANSPFQIGNAILLTGLNPGSTTFKLQHRVTAGTGTFSNRTLSVVPL